MRTPGGHPVSLDVTSPYYLTAGQSCWGNQNWVEDNYMKHIQWAQRFCLCVSLHAAATPVPYTWTHCWALFPCASLRRKQSIVESGVDVAYCTFELGTRIIFYSEYALTRKHATGTNADQQHNNHCTRQVTCPSNSMTLQIPCVAFCRSNNRPHANNATTNNLFKSECWLKQVNWQQIFGAKCGVFLTNISSRGRCRELRPSTPAIPEGGKPPTERKKNDYPRLREGYTWVRVLFWPF